MENSHIVKLFDRIKSKIYEKNLGQSSFLSLTENLAHDHCFIAEFQVMTGTIDEGEVIVFKGFGIEAHEALLDLLDKVENNITVGTANL